MERLQFKLTLNQFVGLILVSAISIRLALLFSLDSTLSSFAPDEETYASLISWVLEGKEVATFPTFGLYDSTKTLLQPSIWLASFGVSPLVSVRIVSNLYGVCNIILLSRVLLFTFRNSIEGCKPLTRDDFWFWLPLSLYAFWPSHTLWTIVGMKESSSEFFLMASFYLVLLISRKWLVLSLISRVVLLVTCMTTLTLSFGTRSQASLAFIILFLFPLCIALYRERRMRANNFSLILVLTASLGLGLQFASPSSDAKSISERYLGVPDDGRSTGILETTNTFLRGIHTVRESRMEDIWGNDANSALENPCNIGEGLGIISTCSIRVLPQQLFAFFLRPLPFKETGSTQFMFASHENTLWALLFGFVVLSVSKMIKSKISLTLVVPSCFYLILFSCLASLSSGNLGTAFRHKSSLLWMLILLTSLALQYLYLKKRRA